MSQTQWWQHVHAIAMAGALLVGLTGIAAAEEVTLTVEPIYAPERAREVYKPLVEYLSRATGHNIKLVTPRNYHFYWADLRKNQNVQLVFEEAHFTDYRIKRYNFVPLVRTLEKSSYTLLSLEDFTENGGTKALVGRSVVSMPAPSLGFALLMEIFPNPIQQPEVRSAASNWRDTVEIVFAGEADAAMVPTWLKDQYPNLIPMETTREFPGAAISAAPGVSEAVRKSVSDAMLKLHEDNSLYEVLAELNVTQFETANAAEFDGAEAMLKDFFGY